MAKQEVTGADPGELSSIREEFDASPKGDLYDFEDWYCLFQIPHQPEEYDGPPRVCKKTASDHETKRCRYHKSRCHGDASQLLPPELANLKHGAYAMRETLIEHMSEPEQELYEEVLSWAEFYHIDKETDPSTWDDLQILASERVRQFKVSKWLHTHGETREEPIFDPEGNIVDYQTETIGPAEEHRRITQLVMGLKRDLGLTRKEQFKQDAVDTVSEGANTLAEAMGAMINSGEKEYDPDEYEFDPDEHATDDPEEETQ